MKKFGTILLILFSYIEVYPQCVQEPKSFALNNSIDTVVLTGRCGNPLDEPNTDFLEPENFGYFQFESNFLINCAFTKNCEQTAYLTVQANDSIIEILKYESDTGESTTCDEYETFYFWFPLPSKGYFHIYVNGYETIVTGLSGTKNFTNNNFSISPNPCTDKLLINIGNRFENKKVEILNLEGKIVYSQLTNTDKIIVNTNNFPKGIYNLRLIYDNNCLIKQFVKN